MVKRWNEYENVGILILSDNKNFLAFFIRKRCKIAFKLAKNLKRDPTRDASVSKYH